MSKTNFTKVEKALDDGLQQIKVSHLLDLADSAAASMGKGSVEHLPSHDLRGAILQSLDRDLKKLQKKGIAVYKKIGYVKSDIKKLISNPEALSPEDWKKIKEIKEKVELYKKELAKNLPASTDEQIIEGERVKHVNKRFNKKETWLPLK